MLPGWEIMLIRTVPDDFPAEFTPFLTNENIPPANRADLFRNWSLWRYGGIYVDMDTRPLRPFDDALLEHGCFIPICSYDITLTPAGRGFIDSCIIGSEAGHAFWPHVWENCRHHETWRSPRQWFCGVNTFRGYADYGVTALRNLCQEATGEETVRFAKGRETGTTTGHGYMKHYRTNAWLALLFGWENHWDAKAWEDVFGEE